MVEVYCYIPEKDTENAVSCGIKLTEWYGREVLVDGTRRKCIRALLNPRDDRQKWLSPDHRCLKLEVPSKYCFVADSMLYEAGVAFPEIMEFYERSVVPVENYAFGKYRLPECLVTCTVLGDNVGILDRRLDSPILYNSSEELYINNIIEGFREIHEDFNDAMLYFFFSRLAETGNVRKLEDTKGGTAVFEDMRDGKLYTFKIPDMGKY